MTQQYIAKLVSTYPSITAVWLFGSHANGRARSDSDWDYLVFSDNGDRLLDQLCLDGQFNLPGIDLLVVTLINDAVSPPWPDRVEKRLSTKNQMGAVFMSVAPVAVASACCGNNYGRTWSLVVPPSASYASE